MRSRKSVQSNRSSLPTARRKRLLALGLELGLKVACYCGPGLLWLAAPLSCVDAGNPTTLIRGYNAHTTLCLNTPYQCAFFLLLYDRLLPWLAEYVCSVPGSVEMNKACETVLISRD